MKAKSALPPTALHVPQIECGGCESKLPLRLTSGNESAALWHCARCNASYVACCVEEALRAHGRLIRLDNRYFDVSDQSPISVAKRRDIARIVNRVPSSVSFDMRRSKRIARSLVAPAIDLNTSFVPQGDPYQVMVANLSQEGIGLVHDRKLSCDFFAIELRPKYDYPVQVIVRAVRSRQLDPNYFEIGGEFFARLGGGVQTSS